MNYADSARIRAVLTNCWFLYTENIQEADIVIFDTCSVRQKSEDKITGKLKELKPTQKVRITGCMIQHVLRQSKISNQPNTLKVGNFVGILPTTKPNVLWYTTQEINKYHPTDAWCIPINHAFNPLFHSLTQKRKNIQLMWRIDDTGFLPIILDKIGYTISYDQECINEYEKIIPENIQTSMNEHQKTAYVPISTGCNQFCAYCIVPYARGLERYFPVAQIVDEAKIHIKNWAQEIVLLWQIVNKHPEFVSILEQILRIPGLKWLRYTSPYPTYYSPELLALHENETKLCPHIHMPLQSGSDNILKKMFRGYTMQQAKEFIDNIKKLKRDISITTDIIVGFPGETEEDFQQTLDLIHYGQFDMIYIGIYSPRPGTFAAKNYPDDISRTTKRDRWNRLNQLLTDISRQNNKQEEGKTKTVLINHINPDKQTIEGYTDNMKQILISSTTPKTHNIGEFINVKITDSGAFKIFGVIEE